jgi:very-short-patch-repair endonuclease
MTPSERILWKELRNKRLSGKKFYRQHPIFYDSVKNDYFFFVADFYCAQCKLVIELDGPIHDLQYEKDQRRDLILKGRGLKVLRIKNEDLKNINKVKQKIIDYLY